MKKSIRFRWSVCSGKGWSVCSETGGQFKLEMGGQFHRFFHSDNIMDINSLKNSVFVGAISKGLEMTDLVLDQLNYELSVIENLEIVEYFIIYSRIIEICNDEGLLRSYGRGSACSSLVNYCLDITKINPLEEGLIFERFLNPAISTMADIDIDVPLGSQKLIVEKLRSELSEYFIKFIAYHPSNQSNTYKHLLINDTEYKKHPCAVIISSDDLQFQKGNFENEKLLRL